MWDLAFEKFQCRSEVVFPQIQAWAEYKEPSACALRTSWSRREHYPNYFQDKGNFWLLLTGIFNVTVSLDFYVTTLKMSLDKDGWLLLQQQIGLGKDSAGPVPGIRWRCEMDRERFAMQAQCQACASLCLLSSRRNRASQPPALRSQLTWEWPPGCLVNTG